MRYIPALQQKNKSHTLPALLSVTHSEQMFAQCSPHTDVRLDSEVRADETAAADLRRFRLRDGGMCRAEQMRGDRSN